MKLSIIVPAYNEERLLAGCLQCIDASLAANRRFAFGTELLVVDNNSTDRTAEIATNAGARVCFEARNQISLARNAGAAAASGEWLMFVDADTYVSPGLLESVLELVQSGTAVGCGSTLRMDEAPRWARFVLGIWTTVSVVCRWPAGSMFVCRADAFRDVGGFSRTLYAAEEIDLSRRLKRWGRRRGLRFFIVKRCPVQSSARKLELYSGREIVRQLVLLCLRPKRTLQSKKYLAMWYDGRR